MIVPIAWIERKFAFDQPVGVFPALLERVRGTPVRAVELVAEVPEETLATRPNGKWSVKEHLGHLVDLQTLDEQRLREFLDRFPVLSPAEIGNLTTENANHRRVPVAEILGRLSSGRARLVTKLETLTEEEVAITALHPRLRQPMRILDWMYFISEHDDHHLANARQAILGTGMSSTAAKGAKP